MKKFVLAGDKTLNKADIVSAPLELTVWVTEQGANSCVRFWTDGSVKTWHPCMEGTASRGSEKAADEVIFKIPERLQAERDS